MNRKESGGFWFWHASFGLHDVANLGLLLARDAQHQRMPVCFFCLPAGWQWSQVRWEPCRSAETRNDTDVNRFCTSSANAWNKGCWGWGRSNGNVSYNLPAYSGGA